MLDRNKMPIGSEDYDEAFNVGFSNGVSIGIVLGFGFTALIVVIYLA